MDVLKSWIIVLTCMGFICAGVKAVAGKNETGVKLVCSLAMLLALLWPLGKLKGMEPMLPRLEDYEAAVTARAEAYTEDTYKRSEAIICSNCAEYISQQAALMGFECEAEVICTPDENGVPIPTGAVLYSQAGEHEGLSQLIVDELGIKKEALDWKVRTYAQD